MKNNISPEEKLLKLIRGKKKPEDITQSSLSHALAKKESALQTLTYPALKKYLCALNLQKMIGLIFIISCIYLAISLIYPLAGLNGALPGLKVGVPDGAESRLPTILSGRRDKTKLPQAAEVKINAPKAEPELEVKPYEFYQQGMANRQIFVSPSAQEREKPMLSGVNIDLIKNMSLVGIIAGETPQAIIEDKNTQKTFYLSKGQFIGEFQVREIKEGKVTLDYKGQSYELYM